MLRNFINLKLLAPSIRTGFVRQHNPAPPHCIKPTPEHRMPGAIKETILSMAQIRVTSIWDREVVGSSPAIP